MNFNRVTLQHNSEFNFFLFFCFVIFITETVLMVSVKDGFSYKNN